MKTSNAKYLIVALILSVGAFGLLFYSCEKETINPMNNPVAQQPSYDKDREVDLSFTPPKHLCGSVVYNPVLDVDGREVGDAYAYNDNDFFYIHIIARVDFRIRDARLHVANDFGGIPLDTDDNPNIQQFQHCILGLPEDQKRVFKIPVSLLHNQSVITVHSEIRKITTDEDPFFSAWIAGIEYGNNFVGRYFSYSKGICPLQQPAIGLGI